MEPLQLDYDKDGNPLSVEWGGIPERPSRLDPKWYVVWNNMYTVEPIPLDDLRGASTDKELYFKVMKHMTGVLKGLCMSFGRAPYEDIKEMEFISEKGCFQLEKSDDIDIDLGQLVGSCVIVKVVFRPGSLYYSTDGLYGNVPQGTVSWFNKILGEDMEVMEGLSR